MVSRRGKGEVLEIAKTEIVQRLSRGSQPIADRALEPPLESVVVESRRELDARDSIFVPGQFGFIVGPGSMDRSIVTIQDDIDGNGWDSGRNQSVAIRGHGFEPTVDRGERWRERWVSGHGDAQRPSLYHFQGELERRVAYGQFL